MKKAFGLFVSLSAAFSPAVLMAHEIGVAHPHADDASSQALAYVVLAASGLVAWMCWSKRS